MWLCSYRSEGLWQRHKQDLIFPSDAQLPDHKASFRSPYHCLPCMLSLFWKLNEGEEATVPHGCNLLSNMTWLSYMASMLSGHCSRCQWTSLCLLVIPPLGQSTACLRAGYDLAELCTSSSTVVCNFCQRDICKFKRFLPEVSKELRPLFSMDMKGFCALVQPGLPWRTKAFANHF